MNKKKKQGIFFMTLGVVFAIIAAWLVYIRPTELPVLEKADFKVGNYEFKLEKLTTQMQREKGLSGREKLSSDQGLLFVFDEEGKYGFWMKEMNFPISIIWLNSECKVTGFKDVATPESYPEVFYPELPSKYVIETNPIPVDVAEGTYMLRNIGSKLSCGFLPQ